MIGAASEPGLIHAYKLSYLLYGLQFLIGGSQGGRYNYFLNFSSSSVNKSTSNTLSAPSKLLLINFSTEE